MWWGPNTSLEGVGSSSITSSPAKGHRGQSPLRVFSFRLPFSLLEPSKASAERHLKLRKTLPPPEHRPSLECLLNTPPHPRLGSGEGNGNPLQYSCLENPVDRGARWAAVHGVAQSRTRLQRLSMRACIGEGNGNPLQYSCLENPVDRRAWWDAVCGVVQSWTWLK